MTHGPSAKRLCSPIERNAVSHYPPKEKPALGLGAEKVLGIGASIVTIVSGVIVILSGERIALLSGILLIGFILYAAWRKHWPAVAIGVVVLALVVIGGLVFTALHGPLIKQPSAKTTASSSQSSSPSPSPSASSASGIQTLYRGNVVLKANEAVDLDTSSPKTADSQSTPVSPYDLYYLAPHSDGTGASLQGVNGVYNVSVGLNPTQAYNTCSQTLGPDSTAHPTSGGSAMFAGSDAVCFETSDHRLGWASVESMQPSNQQAQLTVLVWDKTVPQN
jgi:hypothetical protein